jgi:outer membrane protein TolC
MKTQNRILNPFARILFTVPLCFATSALAQNAIELTVEQAMELGEKNSFAGRIATASVDEAKAKQWQTLTAMFPQLSAESTQLWIDKSVNKLAGKSMGTTTIPERVNTAALVVSQPIVPLGPLYMKLKSDISMSRVAEFEEKQALRAARFGGAEAFIRARKAQEFLGIAEASLKLVEKQKSDADALFRAGRIGNVDLLRFEMALADSRSQYAQAQNIREIAFLALAEATGIPNPAIVRLAPSSNEIFKEKRDAVPTTEDAVSAAWQNRAELKGADARLEMVKYYKMAADFDYLPMVNAFAKYERDFEKKDLTIPLGHTHGASGSVITLPTLSFAKKDIRDSFSYGLALKWTLWDWGARLFKSSEFAANISKARLAKEQIQSGIKLETTQAVLDLNYARSNLEMMQTAAKFAEQAYHQQSLRFQNGAASTSDIITAERDLTRARAGVSSAEGDRDLAWLKVLKASGRDLNQNSTNSVSPHKES